METTGAPMKIHISLETKLLLDTLGRFHTEHRGMVEVKGKGGGMDVGPYIYLYSILMLIIPLSTNLFVVTVCC